MATMTAPPAPPSPSAGEHFRHPNIYANLMPDEVIAARDARRLKHRILVGLAALLGLMILLYLVSVIQTAHAKAELSSAKSQNTSLHKQQTKFAPLIQAQTQAKAITKELGTLMRGDMQWKPLLEQLRKAPQGVTPQTATINLTIVSNATRSTSTQGNAGYDVLNQTGKQSIGTITITGIADDKAAIATYVDFLGNVKGFAAPFPATVSQNGGKYQFSINVIPTTELLGGRYTSPQGGN
jgi:Tfp pilus assembly protein PilN